MAQQAALATTFWAPPISPKQGQLVKLCASKKKKFILANGTRLSTKCVSRDTLIFGHGLNEIGSLGEAQEDLFSDINHPVMSMNGDGFSEATATAFYNSGHRKAFRLKTDMGYELTCSTVHPVWSECDGEIGYRTSEQIAELHAMGRDVWLPLVRDGMQWPAEQIGETVLWFKNQEARSYEASQRIRVAMRSGQSSIASIMKSAKTANPTIHKYLKRKARPRREHILIDPDMAYFLGLLTGDGCYSPPVIKSHCVRFTSADESMVAFVKQMMESAFKGLLSKTKHSLNKYDYVLQSALLRAFLKHLGMSDKYSWQKEVPSQILRSPKPVVVAFLQGLFDTDGMVCKSGGASYCTTSSKLSRQVQTLLLALGVRSSRIFTANEYRGFFLVRPRKEDNFKEKVGFRLERKRLRLDKKSKYALGYSSYPPSIVDCLKRLHATRKERGVRLISRAVHKRIIHPVLRRHLALSKHRIAPLLNVLNGNDDPSVQQFWMSGQVWWDKLVSVEPTECHLVDISVPATHNFVGNGFINHNTVSCLHAVADHAWRCKQGNIAIITISQTVGYDSGIWDDLTTNILPKWFDGGFGMEWVKAPWVMANSKKPTCLVRNKWGGQTKIQLESLKDEQDVEERFKPRRYSMIYVPELSSFHKEKTFTTWSECLRVLDLPANEHLFLADTNPADEGDQSWIYKVWFDLLNAEPEDVRPEQKAMYDQLARMDFTLEDNIFDPPERIAEIKAKYWSDKDLFDRYILGKWVQASTTAHFYGVFRDNFHVVGEKETAENKDPAILCPSENCFQLYTGNDIGHVRNSASVIAEKCMRRTADGRTVEYFNVLDELVQIGEDVVLEDYIAQLLEKMDFWERVAGKPGKIVWKHWSDRNCFSVRDFSSRVFLNQSVFDLSGGRIELHGAWDAQRSGWSSSSIDERIELMRKLLVEERCFLSPRCRHIIEMFKGLKPKEGMLHGISPGSKLKHVFDALTYLTCSELYVEMQSSVVNRIRSTRKQEREQSSLVQVNM